MSINFGTPSAAAVPFLQGGTGAVMRMSQDKMRERLSITDFGALPDAPFFDNKNAIDRAIDLCNALGGADVEIPGGTFYTSPVTKTFTSGGRLVGVHKLATQVYAISASQSHVLDLSGSFTISGLEVNGGVDNNTPASWATYGVITRGGYVDMRDMRAYRCRMGNIWSVTGVSLRRENIQVGFAGPDGSGVITGGVDVGALQMSNISWAANKITFQTAGTGIDHKMRPGDLFYIYNNEQLIGGPYTAVTGTNRTTQTIVFDWVGDPGVLLQTGTFSSERRDGSAISETRDTRIDVFSGSPGATLVNIRSATWDNVLLQTTYVLEEERNFEVGEPVSIRRCDPNAFNGTYTALAGTGGNLLVVSQVTNPGTLTLPGQAFTRYSNGAAFLWGTDCGAYKSDNCQTGAFAYGGRNYDNIGRALFPDTGFGPYSGCAFLVLNSFNSGNCNVAGLSLEVNSSNVWLAAKTTLSAPAIGGVGLIVNSPIAWVDGSNVGFHNCGLNAMEVYDAYGGNITNGTVRDIGYNASTPNGNGFVFKNGGSRWVISGVQFDPHMQSALTPNMDVGILLAADAGGNAFTGTVEFLGCYFRDMLVANTQNLSGSGTLIHYNEEDDGSGVVTASPDLTANEFAALVAANDVIWIKQPFNNVWTTTCDLSALDSKRIIALPCDEPIIQSSAACGLRVGGENMVFDGRWWIKCIGPTVDKLCVEVAPGTYVHRWHTFQDDSWGIGMQGTRGTIRDIVIEAHQPEFDNTANNSSYGMQFYSSVNSEELGLIRVNRLYAIPSLEENRVIMYSIGPNVGSGGLFSFEHNGGMMYGGQYALHAWANKPITAASWDAGSGGVATWELEWNHGVQVGGQFVISDCVGTGGGAAGFSGTFTAIAGTTGRILKAVLAVDPGAVTELGTFGPSTLLFESLIDCPRSIRFTNFTRRAGSGTSYRLDAAADVSFLNCKSDDPGLPITITGATWSATNGGEITYTCAEDSGIRNMDYVFVENATTVGYNGTRKVTRQTDGISIVVPEPVNPGAAGVSLGTIYCCAYGWYIGRYYQGALTIAGGQAHEHNGNAIRHEGINAYNVTIRDFLIYNASNADKAGVWSGYYQDPGVSNVTLENVSSGTGDNWRSASRMITFYGLPAAGNVIYFDGTGLTWRAAAVLPDEVTIGATAEECAANLVAVINSLNYAPFTSIRCDRVGTDVNVIHFPGPVGNSYTLTESSNNVSAKRTVAFSGLPNDGDTMTFKGTVVTFRTVATLPNEVQIAANPSAMAVALAAFITGAGTAPFTGMTAVRTGTDVILTGDFYPTTESAANTSITAGMPLIGGSGTLYQKYGFEGITHGLRNCSIINCNGNNNISGAFSTQQPRTRPSMGGTGAINNDRSTITISGAFPITWTVTADTTLTLPTTGTLAVLEGNTFTGPQVIDVSHASQAALTVIQSGAGDAFVVMDSANPDATPTKITNAGRVIVQDTAHRTFQGSTTPYVQLNATAADPSIIGISNWSATTSAAGQFLFAKAISGTVGTFTGAVAAGTLLGRLGFGASDGTSFFASANIIAEADITATTGIAPGRLKLRTANASGVMTDALTLDSSQRALFAGNITAGAINFAVDAQASDAYIITIDPAPTAYYDGMPVTFRANTANTNACTINVNGLGNRAIVKGVSTTLVTGDILAGMMCDLKYDLPGSRFVLMNPRVL